MPISSTEPAPRLAALDGLDRVIRIGSFSKTLSASVRCGYIAARPDWIEALTDLRIATGFAGDRLSEELVLGVLGDGGYRKHMEALTRAPRQGHGGDDRRACRRSASSPGSCRRPACSSGAACRTVSTPPTSPATRWPRTSCSRPATSSACRRRAGSFMRFNVAQCTDERVFAVLGARDGAGGEKRGRGPLEACP